MNLRIGGWTIGGPPPRLDKFVVVAAPHTEWWDGFWMLNFAAWWGMEMSWLAKQSAVRWPFAGLLLRLGVIPVDRSAPHGLVGQIVEQFERRDRLMLSIPPEGTRARRDYWKSGFYHIARQADVPVCLSYLDFGRREAGFGPCFRLTGRVGEDMDRIRAFYATVQPKVPEKFTPPRLREEDEEEAIEPPSPGVSEAERPPSLAE